MGQARLSVVNLQDGTVDQEGVVAAQAAAAYRSRGVPTDWYVDPADPESAAFHQRENHQSLEDAATAFLTSREEEGPATLHPASVEGVGNEPVWIGLRNQPEDFSDEGELGWQTDALCAQTDPEAFFPEKGGSTRDAKKVCGACNVKAQCLEYALANDERFGIWGGLSERERRRLRKRAV
ncbi:WhiB family transcriptional regulator [Arthrobacter sp. E3]|uniref:WhiB family transcriptional regulator n=1 Tax=Arthrobacter sp. E3 TaxID=517402 RepID=UPI001A950619|nr:WhiB family transcriptional regulator [Arthrobacter sp. E3]